MLWKASWMPFQDPNPESIITLLETMEKRLSMEEWHVRLQATPYERNVKHLKRFLQRHFMDVEIALSQWHGWVKWRHGEWVFLAHLYLY
jgi:hypothetical protein